MYQFQKLIHAVTSGLSIMRWNTFPRTREITTLDHLAFVAHVSIILALSSKEEYDLGIILRKILFSWFFTFKYSDVSSDVKYRLRRKSPELIRQLDEWVISEILSLDIPETIHNDIQKSYSPSKEDTIIAYAKAWASYYEIYNNSLIYPDAYSKLLKSIELRAFEGLNFPLSDRILDFNPHNQTDTERFLLVIHRLASSFRWNRSERLTQVSVFSHTYIITFLAYCIGVLEGIDEKGITDMLLTALYHDIPEAITGDIITPTKKAIPWLEAAIEGIEYEMVHDYLLSYIEGTEFLPMLSRKMLRPWEEKNGHLVKLADMLSAYHEAKLESSHSKYFQGVSENIKKTLSESGKGYMESLF